MNSQDYIKIVGIDQAAVILTLTGVSPILLPGRSMGDEVEIVFPATDGIESAIQTYTKWDLLVPAKQLLVCQKTLTIYAREVMRLHKGVTL